jgi:hypothetical protein
MGSEPRKASLELRAAGDFVEVVDVSSKLYGKVGTVAFFVGDNVYVTFSDVRWSPTKMFFPAQLRVVDAPLRRPQLGGPALLLSKLRLSLARIRL